MSVAAVAYPVRRPPMRRVADALEPWLYAGPVLVLIVAVMLVPLALGISYAFRDVQILNPFSGGFVGLDHFRALGQDEAFFRALRNTFWWTGLTVLIQLFFGLMEGARPPFPQALPAKNAAASPIHVAASGSATISVPPQELPGPSVQPFAAGMPCRRGTNESERPA